MMSYDIFMTCLTTCLTTMFVNRAPGYYQSLIESRTMALNCHQIQWLWMTLNAKIKVFMDF